MCRLLKSSLFRAFRWWEIPSFLRQKVNGKMIFTDHSKVLVLGYRKVLVLSFSVMRNTVFFSQKVNAKVAFTLSFWVFYDVLGPGKYGFSCTEIQWSYVWSHSKLIQSLKENWLVLPKMTWGICHIFTRALTSLKIENSMASFCLKLKMYELKVYRKVMCHDNVNNGKIEE